MPGGFLGGLRRSGDCGRRHDGHRAADDGNAGDDSIDVSHADERDHGHYAGARAAEAEAKKAAAAKPAQGARP